MAFADDYDFNVLENQSEKLVVEELGRQIAAFKGSICLCDTCVIDMAAMAMNTVKPLYHVSLLGTQYTSQAMSERSYAASLKDSVAKAIKRVKDNPAHD